MTTELILPTDAAQLTIQAAILARASVAADQAAAGVVFQNYRERQAANTLLAHDRDFERFRTYLAGAGLAVGDLATNADAWHGMSWGIVVGFVRWQLAEGYAIESVNRALSTFKAYAKLALKAGTLDATTYALIRAIDSYGYTEGKRVDEKREVTRRGAKKAQPTLISRAHAELLKRQPADTPQSRRDELLMCILLDHGLRCGEIAILPADAIDLSRGLLDFYRPKVDERQKHRLTADTLRAALAYLPDLRDLPGGMLIRGSRKSGQLAGDMHERAINARVRLLGAAIGLPTLSPHDCRHTWATFAAEAGTPTKTLQVAGGWKSAKIALDYANAAEIANEGVRLI